MTENETLDVIALALVIIGALNWGLVGILGLDLVDAIVGPVSGTAARVVYALVGLAGLYVLYYTADQFM